jgi:hypothetical protein
VFLDRLGEWNRGARGGRVAEEGGGRWRGMGGGRLREGAAGEVGARGALRDRRGTKGSGGEEGLGEHEGAPWNSELGSGEFRMGGGVFAAHLSPRRTIYYDMRKGGMEAQSLHFVRIPSGLTFVSVDEPSIDYNYATNAIKSYFPPDGSLPTL